MSRSQPSWYINNGDENMSSDNGRNIRRAISGARAIRRREFGHPDSEGPESRATGAPVFDENGNLVGASE
jgi:hypothetical protein